MSEAIKDKDGVARTPDTSYTEYLEQDSKKVPDFIMEENFEFLGIRTIPDRYYGRCFEIVIDNENENLKTIDLKFKQSIFIYVSIPFRFLDFSTQSKIQGNINEDLFMEVNYEVHKNNHGQSCRK